MSHYTSQVLLQVRSCRPPPHDTPPELDNGIEILEIKPADQLTVDTVTTALVGAENTIALSNTEVGSNTNNASTLITGNALAAGTHSGQ